jgi:hypothetical protein
MGMVHDGNPHPTEADLQRIIDSGDQDKIARLTEYLQDCTPCLDKLNQLLSKVATNA